MTYQTLQQWDDEWWNKASKVYKEAFHENGSKNDRIIQRMFDRGLCQLHLEIERGSVIAMSLTGLLPDLDALLIDYLAVKSEVRGQGRGVRFYGEIENWAMQTGSYAGAVIEIEAGLGESERNRRMFWQKCGFQLTSHVHSYIWVPEPYQAMYKNFTSNENLPADGERLFQSITAFHRRCYTNY